MNIYRNKKVAILFMLPALVFVILFIYYPIIQNFIYSLYRWSSFSEVKFLLVLIIIKDCYQIPYSISH